MLHNSRLINISNSKTNLVGWSVISRYNYGFHIAKNFIGLKGKRMESSGFADILEASKVYKPTAIEGILFYYINYRNTTTLPY